MHQSRATVPSTGSWIPPWEAAAARQQAENVPDTVSEASSDSDDSLDSEFMRQLDAPIEAEVVGVIDAPNVVPAMLVTDSSIPVSIAVPVENNMGVVEVTQVVQENTTEEVEEEAENDEEVIVPGRNQPSTQNTDAWVPPWVAAAERTRERAPSVEEEESEDDEDDNEHDFSPELQGNVLALGPGWEPGQEEVPGIRIVANRGRQIRRESNSSHASSSPSIHSEQALDVSFRTTATGQSIPMALALPQDHNENIPISAVVDTQRGEDHVISGEAAGTEESRPAGEGNVSVEDGRWLYPWERAALENAARSNDIPEDEIGRIPPPVQRAVGTGYDL